MARQSKRRKFVNNQPVVFRFGERKLIGKVIFSRPVGKKFTYELNGKPLTFTFSEENMDGDKVEYFGEIRFDGDEFLGVIATDSRGYLTEYDFYSVFDENIRLQDILKEQGIDDETQNFFQEEIINSLKM